MAKRKSTPRTPTAPEEMFTPIGMPDDSGQEEQKPDPVAALQAKFDDFAKESRTREERLQGLFLQLAAGNRDSQPQPQAQLAQASVPPAVNLDFSKLPDPTKDPDGFRRGVQDQLVAQVPQAVTRAVEATVAPVAAAQQRQQQIAGLWTRFKEKHEDIAEHEDIARAVAERLAQDDMRLGRDPLRAALADPDGFVDRVADEVNKVITKIKGAADEGEEEEGGEEQPSDRPAPQRTIGIPGQGQFGGQGKKGAPGASSTMISELKEMQKGIYW